MRLGSVVVSRSIDDRRRDVEGYLDALAEGAIATEGDVDSTEITLRVADDLIDALAAFCGLPPPRAAAHGRVVWRETFGTWRLISLRLRTIERRRLAAA